MLRVVLAGVTLASLLALVLPSAAQANPPFGAKRLYYYQASYRAPDLRSLAKFYADTANSFEPSCSTAQDISTALSRIRVQAKAPARVLSVAKYLFKYAHNVLSVDTSCTAAKKLSAAAFGVRAAARQTYPSCIPSGLIDLLCSWSRLVVMRIDLEVLAFRPDVCYWTFYTGSFLPSDSIKYLNRQGRC
jgi:hypothetical protein